MSRIRKDGKPWGNKWDASTGVPRDEIRHLYALGLSSRQVAERIGVSAGYVSRICSDIARDRSEAVKLRQPMQASTRRRTCHAQARKLTERELGRKLESWEHVHHVNGDYTDNRKENRQVLDARTHAHMHRPPNPVPRHLRPNRQAYMREYFKTYRGAK